MKITFLGATKTVTGSNYLIEAAGKKFLVDCGMFQGKAELEEENYNDFEFDPKEIDFMLLTHAHIDHSGRIPKLYKEGYRNKIYAHKATCDLCALMLPDSGHIQEQESEWKNRKRMRKGEEARQPLYTAEDALRCLEIFEPVKYDEIIDITPEIHARFNDAGHMLGSSIIELWVEAHSYNGNYHLQGVSPMKMIFDDIKLPLLDETTGRNYGINRFGLEMLKFFRALDLQISRSSRGNTLYITIK